MASYNGVQAAVISRPGCRLILAMFLLTTTNTRVGGDYPRSYSQVLCRECQHWGLAGGSIVELASTCGRRYLWAVLYRPITKVDNQWIHIISIEILPTIYFLLHRVLGWKIWLNQKSHNTTELRSHITYNMYHGKAYLIGSISIIDKLDKG